MEKLAQEKFVRKIIASCEVRARCTWILSLARRTIIFLVRSWQSSILIFFHFRPMCLKKLNEKIQNGFFIPKILNQISFWKNG
jgi:hypothetical protein